LVDGDAGATLPRMETAPRMDTSRPSNLRLAAFALTAIGALVIGVGSILTWVTVGFADPHLAALTSPTKGTDITDGKIALGCAVVTLLLVVASRLVSDTVRAVMAGIVVVAGGLATAVAAMFIRSASTKYTPIDSEGLIARIAAYLGKTPDEIRAAFAGVADKLGPYTNVGAGPWVVVVGGVMVVVGGVLTVRWAARLSASHAATDEAEGGFGDVAGDEETPEEPSLD
jgi:hypothetical protein